MITARDPVEVRSWMLFGARAANFVVTDWPTPDERCSRYVYERRERMVRSARRKSAEPEGGRRAGRRKVSDCLPPTATATVRALPSSTEACRREQP
jgi:hypothetical protein